MPNIVSVASRMKQRIVCVLHSGSGQFERPYLKKHNESNIPGLFIVGDLAGAPVIKYAMAQGYEVIEHIASLPGAVGGADEKLFDVVIVGAGAGGLNAALQAQERGLRYVLIEKEQIANTIENFPEGKWVYAEPDSQPPKGKLWLDGASKEELTRRWHEIVRNNNLNLRTAEAVLRCAKRDGIFDITTTKQQYRSKRVVLATGQRGNPRKLHIPGEQREQVYHRLYSPRKYRSENILVVGGGNSAIEAAVTLSEQNKVYLSYRGSEVHRAFRENTRRLKEAVGAGRIELSLNSNVKEFGQKEAVLEIGSGTLVETRSVPYKHAFVLIGADVPREFLKSLGLKMENEWEGSLLRAATLTLLTLLGFWIGGGHASSAVAKWIPSWVGWLVSAGALGALIRSGSKGDRFGWFGLSFFLWYTVYGVKFGKGEEFWPYRDWGYRVLSFFDR